MCPDLVGNATGQAKDGDGWRFSMEAVELGELWRFPGMWVTEKTDTDSRAETSVSEVREESRVTTVTGFL